MAWHAILIYLNLLFTTIFFLQIYLFLLFATLRKDLKYMSIYFAWTINNYVIFELYSKHMRRYIAPYGDALKPGKRFMGDLLVINKILTNFTCNAIACCYRLVYIHCRVLLQLVHKIMVIYLRYEIKDNICGWGFPMDLICIINRKWQFQLTKLNNLRDGIYCIMKLHGK